MKPPEYITDKSQLTRLAKKIVDEHPRGYAGGFVEGPKRSGKTVFCMKTMHQVFQYHYGYDREDAWKEVLKNIMFDLEDVDHMFDRLESIDWDHLDKHWIEDKPICKMWDDVSMHGGKYRFFVDARLVDNLQRNLDVMGIVITGFLMNAPELSNVLSFIRDYHDHTIIRIGYEPGLGEQEYERVAFFNTWRRENVGWRLRPCKPHTRFSCYLGDVDHWGLKEQWVYDEYEKIRGKAIKKHREQFKKMAHIGSLEEQVSEDKVLSDMNLTRELLS